MGLNKGGSKGGILVRQTERDSGREEGGREGEDGGICCTDHQLNSPYPLPPRTGNEELLMTLLTPLNVNCHAGDGRKVSSHDQLPILFSSKVGMLLYCFPNNYGVLHGTIRGYSITAPLICIKRPWAIFIIAVDGWGELVIRTLNLLLLCSWAYIITWAYITYSSLRIST